MLPLILVALVQTGPWVAANRIPRPVPTGIELTAEPGYRSVQLKWKYPDPDGATDFLVKYCEVVWNIKYRCRKRYVTAKDQPVSPDGIYRTTIRHLRMSTNYSFALEPGTYPPVPGGTAKVFRVPSVTVSTNGFAAEISRCVDLWSEIAVRTGPFFAGKITVENSRDERCSVYGNRSSSRDVYILRIRHDICGSHRINDSEIQSTVVVYENKEVVTHNTRRYLVQCNLLPKIFSLRASVHVPDGEKVGQHVRYPVMEGEESTSNHVRDSRIEAEETRFVHRTSDPPEPDQFLLLTVVGCGTVVAAVGAALCLLWARKKTARRSLETWPARPTVAALTSVRCLSPTR